MLWFFAAGLFVGYVSARMAYCTESGIIAHMTVGVLGAYVGMAGFHVLGIEAYNALGMIVIGSLGAAGALWAVRILYARSDLY